MSIQDHTVFTLIFTSFVLPALFISDLPTLEDAGAFVDLPPFPFDAIFKLWLLRMFCVSFSEDLTL